LEEGPQADAIGNSAHEVDAMDIRTVMEQAIFTIDHVIIIDDYSCGLPRPEIAFREHFSS